MSETKEDLQKQLDVFSEYCKFWQLKVNVEKTKILFFSRGRLPNNLTFTFNEMEIDRFSISSDNVVNPLTSFVCR
jgi:hypothetical protein